MAPQLFSIDEAAGILGVSGRFLRLLGRRGDLRVTRLGRRVLVPASEIERLAAKGTP
jgi:excisionase family DNA binding protein